MILCILSAVFGFWVNRGLVFFSFFTHSFASVWCAHFYVFDPNELNRKEIIIFYYKHISHESIFMEFPFFFFFSFFSVSFLLCSRFVPNSFVQEFVAAPLDGVSLLLEVLRSIQLSQQTNINQDTIGKVTAQTYQRRALLDELACL